MREPVAVEMEVLLRLPRGELVHVVNDLRREPARVDIEVAYALVTGSSAEHTLRGPTSNQKVDVPARLRLDGPCGLELSAPADKGGETVDAPLDDRPVLSDPCQNDPSLSSADVDDGFLQQAQLDLSADRTPGTATSSDDLPPSNGLDEAVPRGAAAGLFRKLELNEWHDQSHAGT
jgi:hypothetical protein